MGQAGERISGAARKRAFSTGLHASFEDGPDSSSRRAGLELGGRVGEMKMVDLENRKCTP